MSSPRRRRSDGLDPYPRVGQTPVGTDLDDGRRPEQRRARRMGDRRRDRVGARPGSGRAGAGFELVAPRRGGHPSTTDSPRRTLFFAVTFRSGGATHDVCPVCGDRYSRSFYVERCRASSFRGDDDCPMCGETYDDYLEYLRNCSPS
jgi:hypothetical protein